MKLVAKKEKNVVVFLFLYWLIFLFWLNFGVKKLGTTGSRVDTLVKFFLLLVFVAYFFLNGRIMQNRNIIVLLLISVVVSVSFIVNEGLQIRQILNYYYPILLSFCIFTLGQEFRITQKQLLLFFNVIIITVSCMVLYALLFQGDKFRQALLLTTGYGNELSSFLISNHEYGMYLFFASISCVCCLEIKKNEPLKKKWIYVVLLPLFLGNIILTFSRTTFLGLIVFYGIYCLFNYRKRVAKFFLLVVMIFLIWVLFSEQGKSFISDVVLKGNELGGRDVLIEYALNKFKQGNWFEFLFGYGDTFIRNETEALYGLSSVHNAYLQLLIGNGVITLIIFLLFIVYIIYEALQLQKVDKFWGGIALSLILSGCAFMFTNTAYLLGSPIDSFFLTMFVVILPKYINNSLKAKTFY